MSLTLTEAAVYGWIPFSVVSVLTLVFCSLYVVWFRSVKTGERCAVTTGTCCCALTATLLASALVPVDVFIVSSMKTSHGTFKPWAADRDVRNALTSTVLYTYYTFFGVIICFAFLVLPFAFFANVGLAAAADDDAAVDDDDVDEGMEQCGRKRLCRAAKFTLLSLLCFAALVLVGVFTPFDGSPPANDTLWEKLEFIVDEFESSHGQDLLVFLLNSLNVVGMVLVVFYTGYGLSALPIGMIKGHWNVHVERAAVEDRLGAVDEEIAAIKNRWRGDQGRMTTSDRQLLDRLERDRRMFQRTNNALDQRARSCLNRCIACIRPFQVAFGVLFSLFGLLIFVSLLLENVDKAINSGGPLSGYTIHNGTLPNPADLLLVATQAAFPLDYVIYTTMIVFFIFCSMSGVRHLGIRFLWLSLWKIRAHGTKPAALVAMCANLSFIVLALNVVMFSVVPDYTTFGSQRFVAANATTNGSEVAVVERCDDAAPASVVTAGECVMTSVATLLLAFHSKAWLFGAVYYWLTWAFLVAVVIGATVSIYKLRSRPTPDDESGDEDELIPGENDPEF